MHVREPNNWHVGFVGIIIKLTSVAGKLFSVTWWLYRAHCMKNLKVVWSPWSPADHNLIELVVVAEKVSTVPKRFHKNFQMSVTRDWWFTSILSQFFDNLVIIKGRSTTKFIFHWYCIGWEVYIWYVVEKMFPFIIVELHIVHIMLCLFIPIILKTYKVLQYKVYVYYNH